MRAKNHSTSTLILEYMMILQQTWMLSRGPRTDHSGMLRTLFRITFGSHTIVRGWLLITVAYSQFGYVPVLRARLGTYLCFEHDLACILGDVLKRCNRVRCGRQERKETCREAGGVGGGPDIQFAVLEYAVTQSLISQVLCIPRHHGCRPPISILVSIMAIIMIIVVTKMVIEGQPVSSETILRWRGGYPMREI